MAAGCCKLSLNEVLDATPPQPAVNVVEEQRQEMEQEAKFQLALRRDDAEWLEREAADVTEALLLTKQRTFEVQVMLMQRGLFDRTVSTVEVRVVGPTSICDTRRACSSSYILHALIFVQTHVRDLFVQRKPFHHELRFVLVELNACVVLEFLN